jgi:hypothetical protein
LLQLPDALTAERFLERYWQKAPLFMPNAADAIRPSLSRNELAWLATCDDVESRIVFCDRTESQARYRVANGPFDDDYLQALPARNWTLLVHDVEKHLPAMRRLFGMVPFVPDWRIDDLMISFAAPGGGVGPHRDNYDVFLCQGIGIREWRITSAHIDDDEAASDELQLTREFDGEMQYTARHGDVLYLPPAVAHWGTARRACMTYSIGMRAADGYADPDLTEVEAKPGYLSSEAKRRAGARADELGLIATQTKEWLRPRPLSDDEVLALMDSPAALRRLPVHGMARLAYDDERIYLNGMARKLGSAQRPSVRELCALRRLNSRIIREIGPDLLHWLLAEGAFDVG